MSFRKIQSIQVSERVFDIVCDQLDVYASSYDVKISGYLSTFNNCREQGYVLTVSSEDWDSDERTKQDLHIWVHEHRSGDSIIVRYQHEYPNNGMFSEETYSNRSTWFECGEYQKAAKYIINLVKENFEHEFRGH